MIRFILTAAVCVVAILTFPYAMTPGINSADLILWLAPLAVLAIQSRRSRRRHRRPVSNWLYSDDPKLGRLDHDIDLDASERARRH